MGEINFLENASGKFRWGFLGLCVFFACIIGCLSSQKFIKSRLSPPFETRFDVEAMSENIVSQFNTKREIIHAFKSKGFSIREESEDSFLAYKTANSGKMHYSVLVQEEANGFTCANVRSMGIGL